MPGLQILKRITKEFSEKFCTRDITGNHLPVFQAGSACCYGFSRVLNCLLDILSQNVLGLCLSVFSFTFAQCGVTISSCCFVLTQLSRVVPASTASFLVGRLTSCQSGLSPNWMETSHSVEHHLQRYHPLNCFVFLFSVYQGTVAYLSILTAFWSQGVAGGVGKFSSYSSVYIFTLLRHSSCVEMILCHLLNCDWCGT